MNAPLRRPQISESPPSPPFELKEIRTKDHSGRVITSFEGHPLMWMQDFMPTPRRVVSMRTR
jgi:hypothetical protein